METAQTINARAAALMKQGLALMAEPGARSAESALAFFDDAVELRSALPLDEVPVFRYGLAACWLNRGDALARTAPPRLAEALASYDAGIAVLLPLPMSHDARFPRRLVIAHQNRGLLLRQHDPSRVESMTAAFFDALAMLDTPAATHIPDCQCLRAAVWMNLAIVWAGIDTAESRARSREAALRARDLVASAEREDVVSAEVALKACHLLCREAAVRLPERSAAVSDDVHDVTDMADEGLALARAWERKGVSRFRELALDLFRFGGRVYAFYQPQFVREFVAENMDPARSSPDYVSAPPMQAAALEALGTSERATACPVDPEPRRST